MSLKKQLANLAKEKRLNAQNVTKKVALDSPLTEENKAGKHQAQHKGITLWMLFL